MFIAVTRSLSLSTVPILIFNPLFYGSGRLRAYSSCNLLYICSGRMVVKFEWIKSSCGFVTNVLRGVAILYVVPFSEMVAQRILMVHATRFRLPKNQKTVLWDYFAAKTPRILTPSEPSNYPLRSTLP
ncbi:hypothetical protein L596_001097 [Steinernema carpocapsae]|uniref:Uncharacterized protein n=1 Tax=Steinernema carpocapsae TaxID=34508 RepID=A0A4U8ULA2_STECR|nr:hypothetical protein L596_001097 [Steinernema carpocapsae]